MKRFLALFLALAMLGCAGCTSNEAYYQQAQRFLGSGKYDTAARLFEQLGGYQDSTEYALYAAGLYALQCGDTALARHSLQQVDPFLNSSRYLTYLEAADLAQADHLEEAARLYTSLGAFCDSADRAAAIRADIPARDIRRARALMNSGGYEQALSLLQAYAGMAEADECIQECQAGLQRQAYDQATALYDEGRFDEAMAAFEALGDTLDAKARMLSCRGALYAQAEADYASVTLNTCEALMARYAAMEDYLNSEERIAAMAQRFGVNLRLCKQAERMPYVRYGSYPTAENGEAQPLLWQVLGVHEGVATLLSCRVIDAMPAAAAAVMELGIPEKPQLPDREMVSTMTDLQCAATSYAMAQGVRHHSDGRAWWWLADAAEQGRQAIVWYNGRTLLQGVQADDPTVGVRPVICLDLNLFSLTGGSGTAADPYY